jgi:hypothetical protein
MYYVRIPTLKYDVNIVNGTTGPDGKFNVTVTFKVPKAPGGVHTVSGVVDTTTISSDYVHNLTEN